MNNRDAKKKRGRLNKETLCSPNCRKVSSADGFWCLWDQKGCEKDPLLYKSHSVFNSGLQFLGLKNNNPFDFP